MSEKRLVVLINGQHAGDLTQDRHGQIGFAYSPAWQQSPSATPLSLSLPLYRADHGHRAVDPFLRGLLPDNQAVLDRWGARYGVSARNPFALLVHVGEDVAGAAQFVREERVEEARDPGFVEVVDEAYIAERLRTLRDDRAAWTDTHGEFSLAGAQSKFALYRAPNGSWGLPRGRRATTHIFKPPLEHLAHQEVNEHICLRAAARLRMPTASSRVEVFGDEPAIVLERYDRVVRPDGAVLRIHQEDICQALGVHPDRKYQRGDGGPGALRVIDLLRAHQPPSTAEASVETFCRALAFNWVIYGPDAHAKNYSLLLSSAQVRLAPLYDIASVAPYPDQYDLSRMMMAMSINGRYQNNLIGEADWRSFAEKASIDPDAMASWVRDVATRAPDAFSDVIAGEPGWIRAIPMTIGLLDGVAASAKDRLQSLGRPAPSLAWTVADSTGGSVASGTRCTACGRPLRGKESLARGLGPTCARKRRAP